MPSVVDTPMLPLPFFPLPHQIQTVSVVAEQPLPLDGYTNPMDFIPRVMIENYKRNMDM